MGGTKMLYSFQTFRRSTPSSVEKYCMESVVDLCTLFRCFTGHIFSCAAPAFRRLFLNISSAARGLCCLRRSVDIFPGLSINQAACSPQVSECSNSEPAGPGQNAIIFGNWGSSKRVTIWIYIHNYIPFKTDLLVKTVWKNSVAKLV